MVRRNSQSTSVTGLSSDNTLFSAAGLVIDSASTNCKVMSENASCQSTHSVCSFHDPLDNKSSVLSQYTAISRKVVGKMCTRQSPKVIWDMINTLFLTTVPVEPTFVAFLQHSQTHFHGPSYQFFQISLKKSELKTTHNAFRDCRVHFFRQSFSKQLYSQEVAFAMSDDSISHCFSFCLVLDNIHLVSL